LGAKADALDVVFEVWVVAASEGGQDYWDSLPTTFEVACVVVGVAEKMNKEQSSCV
jgi:hypothetical protein